MWTCDFVCCCPFRLKAVQKKIKGLNRDSGSFLLLLSSLSRTSRSSSGICPSVLLSDVKVEDLTLSPAGFSPSSALLHVLGTRPALLERADTRFDIWQAATMRHTDTFRNHNVGTFAEKYELKLPSNCLTWFFWCKKTDEHTHTHTCRRRLPPQLWPLVRRRLLIGSQPHEKTSCLWVHNSYESFLVIRPHHDVIF